MHCSIFRSRLGNGQAVAHIPRYQICLGRHYSIDQKSVSLSRVGVTQKDMLRRKTQRGHMHHASAWLNHGPQQAHCIAAGIQRFRSRTGVGLMISSDFPIWLRGDIILVICLTFLDRLAQANIQTPSLDCGCAKVRLEHPITLAGSETHTDPRTHSPKTAAFLGYT